MAEPTTRYQRWDIDGTLVEDYEVAKSLDQFNAETLRERVLGALADNRAFIANASPTNADAIAAVKDLCRQNNALIRIIFDLFDGTD